MPLCRVGRVDNVLLLFFSHYSGSNQLGPIYGHTSVTSGSLLDDHHWHSVLIERQGRSINLTLDRSVQHFRTNGEFDYLDLDYEVNLRMCDSEEGGENAYSTTILLLVTYLLQPFPLPSLQKRNNFK